MRKPHAAQDVRRLRELNVVVADDLDAISPRIVKVEERTRLRLDASIGKRLANCIFVIDHQPKVAPVVARLFAAGLQRKELVAQVDEGHAVMATAQGEIEQETIERQGLVD